MILMNSADCLICMFTGSIGASKKRKFSILDLQFCDSLYIEFKLWHQWSFPFKCSSTSHDCETPTWSICYIVPKFLIPVKKCSILLITFFNCQPDRLLWAGMEKVLSYLRQALLLMIATIMETVMRYLNCSSAQLLLLVLLTRPLSFTFRSYYWQADGYVDWLIVKCRTLLMFPLAGAQGQMFF